MSHTGAGGGPGNQLQVTFVIHYKKYFLPGSSLSYARQFGILSMRVREKSLHVVLCTVA